MAALAGEHRRRLRGRAPARRARGHGRRRPSRASPSRPTPASRSSTRAPIPTSSASSTGSASSGRDRHVLLGPGRRREHRVVGHQPQHRVRAARQHREPALPLDARRHRSASAATPTGCWPTRRSTTSRSASSSSARATRQAFTDWYLIPMGDAIWSTPPGQLLELPRRHVPALLRQPRAAARHRQADVAQRASAAAAPTSRRAAQQLLRRGLHRRARRARRAQRRRRHRRHRQAHRASTTRSCSRPTRPRRSSMLADADRRSSARFSARSPSSPTRSRCTPT